MENAKPVQRHKITLNLPLGCSALYIPGSARWKGGLRASGNQESCRYSIRIGSLLLGELLWHAPGTNGFDTASFDWFPKDKGAVLNIIDSSLINYTGE